MQKFLLFDIAGTLCDLPVTKENWLKMNQEGFENVMEILDPENGTNKKLMDEFISRKAELRKLAKRDCTEFELVKQLEDFFSKHGYVHQFKDPLMRLRLEEAYILPELSLTTPFVNVEYVLKELKKKYTLISISNNASARLAEMSLEKCNVRQYFDHLIVSAHLGVRKPHGDFFKQVEKLTGAKPKDCIIIGDRLTQDIELANRHGAKSIFIAATEHEDNEGAGHIKYDHKVTDLKELLFLLK